MEYQELEADKQQLVDEFKAITDSGDDDLAKVIRLLDIHDWDLNNSISSFFDSGFVTESNYASANTPLAEETIGASSYSSGVDVHESDIHSNVHSARTSSLQTSMYMEDLMPKLPFAPKISNNWQLEIGINLSRTELIRKNLSLLQTSTKNQYKMIKSLHTILFLIFFIPNKLVSFLYHILRAFNLTGPANSGTFPVKFDYDKLINESESDVDFSNSANLARMLGPFMEKYVIKSENFNEVYDDCKSNHKWLLVILIDDSSECESFVTSLLGNEVFAKNFDTTHHNQNFNSVIYINNVERNPESFEVGKTYKSKRIPYLMLINNVSNSPSVMALMSICYKSNISTNFISETQVDNTCAKLATNLNKLVAHYQPQVVSVLTDKRELEFSRLIKQKQDDAYNKSLEMDKQKKEEKIKQQNQLRLQTQKANFLTKLAETEWFEQLNSDCDSPIRIQIKLPTGERMILKLGDVTFSQLYLHLESKLHATNSDSDDEMDPQDTGDITPDNFTDYFSFGFELVQPYPKKLFDQLDDPVTQHLKSGASLLVERLESEQDTDSDSDSD